MTDEREHSDRQQQPPGSDDTPEVEDAYAPSEPAGEPVLEDEPELLDPTSRSLEGESAEPDDSDESAIQVSPTVAHEALEREDAGDTDSIPDEPEPDLAAAAAIVWDRETVPHRVAVELKRVETQIRKLLEGGDSKRKRRLTGTRRWLELEEDIISWRFSSRFDEETLARLRQLVTRRHWLFRRLRFLASTRATWNT